MEDPDCLGSGDGGYMLPWYPSSRSGGWSHPGAVAVLGHGAGTSLALSVEGDVLNSIISRVGVTLARVSEDPG